MLAVYNARHTTELDFWWS